LWADDTLFQIHYLLDGGVEARQQHVVHDHDADLARYAFIIAIEGQLEALDRAFIAGRCR